MKYNNIKPKFFKSDTIHLVFRWSIMFENNLTQEKISSDDERVQLLQNGGAFGHAVGMFEVTPKVETMENRTLNERQVKAW